MIFRVHHEGTIYEIEAPDGARPAFRGDGRGELILFERMPGGTLVERRIPHPVVIEAARRRYLGLAIRRERRPWAHPEVSPACPVEGGLSGRG